MIISNDTFSFSDGARFNIHCIMKFCILIHQASDTTIIYMYIIKQFLLDFPSINTGPSKISVPSEEEPLYMTIRSVKNTTARRKDSDDVSEDEAPEPPPMRPFTAAVPPSEFESLSRAEQ